MPRRASYTLTPEQEQVAARYKGWMIGVKGYERDTYTSYLSWFRWMLGHGFDWIAFSSDQESAWRVGLEWCALRRSQVKEGGYNGHVKVLNNLAEMLGYGIHFKPARNPPRSGRPNTLQEREKAAQFKSVHKEFKDRTLAVWHFSQELGARRGAVWALHEQHLDPNKSRVFLARPGKMGEPGWVTVRRSLWDPNLPFGKWLPKRPRAEDDPGWIWTTSHGGRARRVAKGTLTRNMQKLSQQTGTKFSFVTGRYTAVTETAAPPTGSGDLIVAKERARHARIETTMDYTKFPEAWVEERYRRIKRPPLVPRKRRGKQKGKKGKKGAR